jgi:hypothetical protein
LTGWSGRSSGRKKTGNRKHYSGKKKRHTRKAIVMVEPSRRIGCLTPGKRGARHGKRLFDQRQIVRNIPDGVTLLADSGLQGIRHGGLCVPIKASKRRPLGEGCNSKLCHRWNRSRSRSRSRSLSLSSGMGGEKEKDKE